MFSVLDRGHDRNCQGYCRREFLRIGGLGLLGGMTLPNLLRARSQATSAGRSVKERSVVLLFLQGGPSHIEFFDPKMSAPEDVRSMTGEVKTVLPGITFGGTFTKLAQRADKLAVVRSYASMNADHSYLAVTSGGNPLKASMSALYARVAGATHPRTGMPNNVLVLPGSGRSRPETPEQFRDGGLAHPHQPPANWDRPFGLSIPAAAISSRRTSS